MIDYANGDEVGTIIGEFKDQGAAFFLAEMTTRGKKAEVYANVNGEEILVYRTRSK